MFGFGFPEIDAASDLAFVFAFAFVFVFGSTFVSGGVDVV